MTQLEFEDQLRELKLQKKNELFVLRKMQMEVKDEIARMRDRWDELQNRLHRLNLERISLGKKSLELERLWNERIAKFTQENKSTSRNLENVSDWALVNEFLARGFTGNLYGADKGEVYLSDLNKKFNGDTSED